MNKKGGKQMKNVLRGMLFWLTAIAIIIIVSVIANVLAEIITMKMIMTVVYIALRFSIVYIFKEE